MGVKNMYFDSVIGYDDLKLELARVLDIIRNPERYSALGVKTPSGILLHGAPGVGKTLFANEFLKASGRPCFVCRKDKPNGEFVNEIKNVFEKAMEASPSIILLDDMDKFASSGRRRANDDEFVTIQSCIDEINSENKEVFIFATANDVKTLPESLIRAGRFDKVIEVRTPAVKDAAQIIKHYLSNKPVVSNLDFEELARILQGHSCAELESIINEAGIYSGFDGRDCITRGDILKAIMRNIFEAPETVEPRGDKYEKSVAIHEAGHALIAELLSPGSVNLVSVNRHSGGIGGIASYYQDDNYWLDITYMENRVLALLGGKAATEIKLGITDIGANSDTKRAFSLVERFIDNYCSYGFDKFEFAPPSQSLTERKEAYIHAEMDRYYKQVKRLIAENIPLLDKITDALILKKTITGADIRELKSA